MFTLVTSCTYLVREANVLNTYMNDETFLQTIFLQFHSLGLANTQDEFSRLCGRTPTWFSSLKARRLSLSTDAAITLHNKLEERIATDLPRKARAQARAMSAQLLDFARHRAASRLQM
jgi:hypothetical protein